MPRPRDLIGPFVLVLAIVVLVWATGAVGGGMARDGLATQRSASDTLRSATTAVEAP